METEFYGPRWGTQGDDGVGHFLNLQPFLELGVKRYTRALQRRTGMQVALNWFLMSSGQMEMRLLATSTALEHLVSTYVKRQGSPKILHPRSFSALERRIQQAFSDAQRAAKGKNDAERRKAIARIREKIPHINDASFRDKLSAMLSSYDVPIAGLEKAIGKAVHARNVVVHTGLYVDYSRYRELYLHVVVLRELVKRIFLKLLGYTGQYHSMLNGPEWVAFPPNGPTTVEPA